MCSSYSEGSVFYKAATALMAEFMFLEKDIKKRNNVNLNKDNFVQILAKTIDEYWELDELRTDKLLLQLIDKLGRTMKVRVKKVTEYPETKPTSTGEIGDVASAHIANQANPDDDGQLPAYLKIHDTSPKYTEHAMPMAKPLQSIRT